MESAAVDPHRASPSSTEGDARLFEHLPAPALVTDVNGKILRANGVARDILAGTRNPLDGRLLVTLVHQDDRRRFRLRLLDAAEPGIRDVHVRLLPRGRPELPATLAVARLSGHGEPARLVWLVASTQIISDPLETKEAAELERLAELTAAERDDEGQAVAERAAALRLGRLFEHLAQGVIFVDRDLRVVFANATATRIATRQLDEGADLPDVWPDASLRELVSRVFSTREHVQRTIQLQDATFDAVATLALNTGHVLLVLTDVTERERRERAQRDFVENAAHELQTPVAAISGAASALRLGAASDAESSTRFLDYLVRECERLGRLVDSLLLLARAQSHDADVPLEPVALRPLLERVAESTAPKGGVRLDVLCPDALEALASPELLERALENLASNAARYTERGRIVLVAMPMRGSTVVEVRDTGPGMSVSDQQRAFERFHRGHPSHEGSGLGLSIARAAVTAFGGTLELSSVPGAGTVAKITLTRSGE